MKPDYAYIGINRDGEEIKRIRNVFKDFVSTNTNAIPNEPIEPIEPIKKEEATEENTLTVKIVEDGLKVITPLGKVLCKVSCEEMPINTAKIILKALGFNVKVEVKKSEHE